MSQSQLDQPTKLNLAVEVLQTFGEFRFVAHGVSMLPTILPGDMMVVRRARFDEIREGDVVLYARNESFYAHRVISAGCGQNLITRGDAMPQPDAPVLEAELLGRVFSVVRNLKTVPVTRHSGAWLGLQRWVLRHSDVAVGCYLRGARFYARSKQIMNKPRTRSRKKIQEYS